MDPISLKWNNHNSSLINSLDHFKAVDSFVDVTLVCEGHTVKAHKIILSAGSNVLRRLLLANPAKHPILILAETKYDTLRLIIDFLYKGQVDIPRDDLDKVLRVATTFEINDLRNLCEESLNSKKSYSSEENSHSRLKSPNLNGSSPKRKRQRRQSSDSDISIEHAVLKSEISSSPCRLEQPEVSPFTDTLSVTAQTELVEFLPQISNPRSVLRTSVASSTISDLTDSSVQKILKDASTECDIQPLKEMMSNYVPVLPKPKRSVLKPRYTEVTEDSESDTQNNTKALTKNKRSPLWLYFVRLNESYAICKLCHKKLSYRTTVTNLRKHLKKKHLRFDPDNPPKLPDLPLLTLQREQLEVFEEIDFNIIEAEAGIQDDEHLEEDEHLQNEEALDEDFPSTSTPCILKIT